MGATPEKYLFVITCEQQVEGNLMTLTNLEIVMYQLWRQLKGSIEDHTTPEITLAGFEGYCYECKQQGHKADKYPNQNKTTIDNTEGTERNEARFQGNCRNCGKQGHEERKCLQKEENKSKRPQGYKMPNEMANLILDENNAEYLLCGVTNPTENKILLDQNTWIADTAASVHATAHKEGLQDINKTRTTIMMTNGNTETTTETGTLKGTIGDQHGNELNKAMIEKVSYLPNGTFNLFSIAQMMAKGWTIGGDKDSIWIKKDQSKENNLWHEDLHTRQMNIICNEFCSRY
jgi:hypothetical protein